VPFPKSPPTPLLCQRKALYLDGSQSSAVWPRREMQGGGGGQSGHSSCHVLLLESKKVGMQQPRRAQKNSTYMPSMPPLPWLRLGPCEGRLEVVSEHRRKGKADIGAKHSGRQVLRACLCSWEFCVISTKQSLDKIQTSLGT